MKKENVEMGECFGRTSCSGAADYEKHQQTYSNGIALLYYTRTVKVTITKENKEKKRRERESAAFLVAIAINRLLLVPMRSTLFSCHFFSSSLDDASIFFF